MSLQSTNLDHHARPRARRRSRAAHRRLFAFVVVAVLLCGSCSTRAQRSSARPPEPENAASVAPPEVQPPHPVYYVDSDGGDDANSGTTPGHPWRTLAKVNGAQLEPGAGVLLKRGASWTDQLLLQANGTREKPIRVAAYGNGPLPVIHNSGCILVTGSFVTVADVAVQNCAWAGIELRGNSDVVEYSTIRNNVAGVVVESGTTLDVVRNNQMIDNNRMSVLTRRPTNDDSGAWGIVVHGDNADISYNTIVGSDAFSYDYGRDGAAIEIYGAIGTRIHHNVATNNNAFTELGNSRSSDNLYAYNLVTSTLEASTGFVTRGAKSNYGPVTGTRVFNNTVVLSGSRSEGFACGSGCDAAVLRMRNNIFVAAGKVGYADAPFDESYDVFFGGDREFKLGPKSVVADPRFTDPAAGNYVPVQSSPAVDEGAPTPFTTDLDGTPVPSDGDGDGVKIPDRGAFERRAPSSGTGR